MANLSLPILALDSFHFFNILGFLQMTLKYQSKCTCLLRNKWLFLWSSLQLSYYFWQFENEVKAGIEFLYFFKQCRYDHRHIYKILKYVFLQKCYVLQFYWFKFIIKMMYHSKSSNFSYHNHYLKHLKNVLSFSTKSKHAEPKLNIYNQLIF